MQDCPEKIGDSFSTKISEEFSEKDFLSFLDGVLGEHKKGGEHPNTKAKKVKKRRAKNKVARASRKKIK